MEFEILIPIVTSLIYLSAALAQEDQRENVTPVDPNIAEHHKTFLYAPVIVQFKGGPERAAAYINTQTLPPDWPENDYDRAIPGNEYNNPFPKDSLPWKLFNLIFWNSHGVVRFLKNHCLTSQSYCMPVEWHYLWATNEIAITNAEPSIVNVIRYSVNVTGISYDETSILGHCPPTPNVKNPIDKVSSQFPADHNIKAVNADFFWEAGGRYAGRGRDIVIGVIDSGAHMHEALRRNYRGNEKRGVFGWYDPVRHQLEPYDNTGHGTGVTCVIAASNENVLVGVAPEANWMACKALDIGNVGSYSNFIRCVQWMVCPTDPTGGRHTCGQAPNIVNHSFGYTGNLIQSRMFQIFQMYQKCQILVVQSAGNSGRCNAIKYEAISPYPIVVGAINPLKYIWSASSKGPNLEGKYMPNLVAPGAEIMTCDHRTKFSNDNQTHVPRGYVIMQGTSMAAAHVSGVAALVMGYLVWYDRRDVTKIRKDIVQQSSNIRALKKYGHSCGNSTDTDIEVNNIFGYGLVDARFYYIWKTTNIKPRFDENETCQIS